jgi:hypothetical protein
MIFKTNEREINTHKCGELKCPNCEVWYLDNHECFMEKKEIKDTFERVFTNTNDLCEWVLAINMVLLIMEKAIISSLSQSG